MIDIGTFSELEFALIIGFHLGLCTRDLCPYRHVQVNADAKVCPGMGFLINTLTLFSDSI